MIAALPARAADTLHLTSPAFADQGSIPALYTCEGKNISPPLAWSGVPEGTKSLALIVDDPDAPDPAAPKRTFVHWVVFNIPANVNGLSEGAALPAGTRGGSNDHNHDHYDGPCPPIGKHRYFFKLYALDVAPDLPAASTKAQLERAMQGHVVGQGVLIGKYEKAKP